MLLERNSNNDLIIRLSSSVDEYGLQRVLDYIRYLEISSKSKGKQSDADKLAKQANASWWSKNRKRFVK
jgi:hypothetical protein